MRASSGGLVAVLAAFEMACGGQHGELVEVAPASHNGGEPVVPSSRPGDLPVYQGPPHAGSWTPTRSFRALQYIIEYPATARAYLTTDPRFSEPILWVQDLPECTAGCEVFISVSRVRERISLDSAVRLITAPASRARGQPATRVIDTTVISGHRAIRLAIDCRGCSETSYVTERHGWIAQINMTVSNYDVLLAPQLETIVRSFRWRDLPPEPTPDQ